MKKTLLIVLAVSGIAACKPRQDAGNVKNETMKLHDEVMADHGKIVANQMRIDTLLKEMKTLKQLFPAIDTLQEKTTLTITLNNLFKAEESMNNWMHNFNPDFESKSEDSVITYYKTEKQKIRAIDSLYKKEIKKSDLYLLKFKKP